MNHASVFVNDASEACRVLRNVSTKGSLYEIFRLEPRRSDLLTSDGNEHHKRAQKLAEPLTRLSAEDVIHERMEELRALLEAKGGDVVDIDQILASLSLDLICSVLFRYRLGALQNSEQGVRLKDCLRIFQDAKATKGLYANPLAQPVAPDTLAAAEQDWRAFITLLCDHIQQQKDSSHGSDGLLKKLLELANLEAVASDTAEVLAAEVHQLLRHSHDLLVGTMTWMVYSLAKHKRLREKVEAALWNHDSAHRNGFPEYLECFLKEILRRYPAAGNFTVRTVEREAYALLGGAEVPIGSTLHVHMFSLQNTTREWVRPMEILPERWMTTADSGVDEEGLKGPTHCPFAASGVDKSMAVYEGAGFQPNALSYFPFSAGDRACVGKSITLQILRQFLVTIVRNFHLNFADALGWENDPGISLEASIVPLNPKVLKIQVVRILDLGKLVAGEEGGLETVEVRGAAEGWAAPEDDATRHEPI